MAASQELLLQQYYHVTLPRDVPGREDRNLATIESKLLIRLTDAVKAVIKSAPLEHQPLLDKVRLALTTSQLLNVEGKIDKTILARELQQLGKDQALILYVTEQNAGLLVFRELGDSDDGLIFESFEASAACTEVLASEAALEWNFPGRAALVPHEVSANTTFQESLAAFLEQASIESVKKFAAMTLKASSPMPEVRDTTNPALITGLFMTILEANGTPHNSPILTKRVRDTVSFKEAYKPWRRSPFYLALRVAIQRHLYRVLGPEVGQVYFKTIICAFLSDFLGECRGNIPPEACQFLKQKLGRRLAKLSQDRVNASASVTSLHDTLVSSLEAEFEKTLSTTGKLLDQNWARIRLNTRRPIRVLPRYASDHDLVLQLQSSGDILNGIAFGAMVGQRQQLSSSSQLINLYEKSRARAKPFASIADRYLALAETVERKVVPTEAHQAVPVNWSERCLQLSRTIETYISAAGCTFDGLPELKSGLILDLMELWVKMDRYATTGCPLIKKYHPGFDPEILDALEFLPLCDLKRVQRVQTYLSQRCTESVYGSRTIFGSPHIDSFAVQYYDSIGQSTGLKELHRRIESDAEESRARKELEWRDLSERHENLMRRIAESSCPYITRFVDGMAVKEHQKGCLKHKYKWQAKQIKIQIFEHPLPEKEPEAKAAIFELTCPEDIASYRDATWLILATFAFRSSKPLQNVPVLREYSGLAPYVRSSRMKVSLGSSTKSHLDSHYAESGFPVALRHVCRPCGLSLDYFDSDEQTWTRRHGKPSFSPHFPLALPMGSPYECLDICNQYWPSSNDIVASQTKCPVDLNVHEFTAWQGLLGSKYCRWFSLLRELGSTNLNFSTESNWAVTHKIIFQVGSSTDDHPLRDTHAVFSDEQFCCKLLEQVNYRLAAIQRNWREPVQMNMLISILLKVDSLCPFRDTRAIASDLLDRARFITWDWCVTLQSNQLSSSREGAQFITWASVLCKRTFQRSSDPSSWLLSKSLQYFIGASVILQEYLVGKFEELPHSLRSAVAVDLLYNFRIRDRLRDAIRNNSRTLLSALNDIWPIPDNFLEDPPEIRTEQDTWWVEVAMKSKKQRVVHYIHYNIVRGDLLIDGKQSGTLPAEYRKYSIIETLFGTNNLRVWPSYEPGMSLIVAREMPFNHRVHLGFRGEQLVVRASQHRNTLELINPTIFRNGNQFDLPISLIEKCHHWLNLDFRVLEIRQDDPWKSKDGNWRLNLHSRRATRRESVLVDPSSLTARNVANNFKYFEFPGQLTIYQPKRWTLSVELKRLELSFFVNHANRLQCRQLGAEVVQSNLQDPGTWYGLMSKIVLQSTRNINQRIILIPEGNIECKREGSHTLTVIKNKGSYLKFEINNVLGRLECPAEPLLLYTKALYHAYTSYFLPDPLTGRTGMEEALYLLRSGLYMPWAPLSNEELSLLKKIAELTPERVYYPPSLKCMELVNWKQCLTTTIQDDQYRRVLYRLFQRSSQLQCFMTDHSDETTQTCPSGNLHLEARAIGRSGVKIALHDRGYRPRDARKADVDQAKVLDITKRLVDWSGHLSNTGELANLLQKFPIIGGFTEAFDRIQLFDLISINVGENWGPLAQTALHSNREDRYRLMFLFAPMTLSADAPIELLKVLLAYAINSALKEIALPMWPSYLGLRLDEEPNAEDLSQIMRFAHRPYVRAPCRKYVRPGDHLREQIERERAHINACEHNCLQLARSIRAQWPKVEVDRAQLPSINPIFLDVNSALEPVLDAWTRLAQNFEFSQYVKKVQVILDKGTSAAILAQQEQDLVAASTCGTNMLPYIYPTRVRGREQPTLTELLNRSFAFTSPAGRANMAGTGEDLADTMGPSIVHPDKVVSSWPDKIINHSDNPRKVDNRLSHIRELESIVKRLRTSVSSVQKNYGSELEQSVGALVLHTSRPPPVLQSLDKAVLDQEIQHSSEACEQMLLDTFRLLEKDDHRAQWLKHAGLWPRLSRVALLTELRSTSSTHLSDGVKEVLVEFALHITTLQRLLRIQDALNKQKEQQLYDERANVGHMNWSPLEHPDWLLLEVDSDMILREEQVDVANATISPASGKNSVVQLQMGKGKTSCILPMVAAVLADKQHLLRIVVPRALLLQSAQVMQIKLGGLLDREIIHIPFSRKTRTDRSLLQTYSQLHTNLKKNSGIVLALPEHMLSFKLSGLQRLCDENIEEGKIMIKMQEWLERHARDVLDECDVSLAIRTQLIYPSGSQMTVDGHPLRWQSIESVLRLLRCYLPTLERDFPHSIEVVHRDIGDYPLLYFLRRDVEEYLVARIVNDICEGQLRSLPFAEIPAEGKDDIRSFISLEVVSASIVDRVTAMFQDKQHLVKVLYLLRGLFVHRVLLSALKKRWNVQYGLHPTRDPLAVPYLAKGVPSPSSEWGHPDVAIILTCLSFYYQGLDLSQFKQTFEQMLKADEPGIEYDRWATDDLPESLRDYNAINVEDLSQLRQLHGYIRFNVYLLDFYLNNFVFPRYARQFDTKLQASGWDLVLFDRKSDSIKTTGFSGTNDSRHQLPLMIKQDDLRKLTHTNAEVLSYLLERRNREYVRMTDGKGRRLSEEGLLQKLVNPKIRILIDAGAQILEHNNESLVKAWLKIDHEAAAAVFFDSNHRPWVLHRKGKRVQLIASPYAENLEDCVVYIDESHCRGTDLKLPPNARAALTLGPHVTKDALAQAAMRLRLLGRSQAVTFFSPPEVHQSILDLAQKPEHSRLDSSDVIHWLLQQSCQAIEQLEPLYFSQGMNYLRHLQAKIDNPDYLERLHQRDRLLSVVRSKELHTLKHLYEPKKIKRVANNNVDSFHSSLGEYSHKLTKRKELFQDSSIAVHSSTFEEVEQEREVEIQVEAVRETQKPVHFTALKVSPLHKHIEEFAKSGRFVHGSEAYQTMFSALHSTATGRKFGPFSITTLATATGLYVSTAFSRTVKVVEPNDNFIRPCHWVVWCPSIGTALVVSPEEADALVPILRRRSGKVEVHLIVYSAPVTRRMLQFNSLNFYALPPLPKSVKAPCWLKVELGLFSGRLYFDWNEYDVMIRYLGPPTKAEPDGELDLDHAEAFTKKPLTFLHEWLAVRRKGQDFEHTPMGFVTTSKPLAVDHPFFHVASKKKINAEPTLEKSDPRVRSDGHEESDDDDDSDDEEAFCDEEDLGDVNADHVDEDEFDEDAEAFFDAAEYVEDEGKAESETVE